MASCTEVRVHAKLQHFRRSLIVALCTSGSNLGGFEVDSVLAGLSSLILTELTFGTAVTPHRLKGQFSDEPPQYFKSSDISLDEEEFRSWQRLLLTSQLARLAELTITCGKEVHEHLFFLHTHGCSRREWIHTCSHTHTHTQAGEWCNLL